jgi:hypothetical protein
LIHTRSHNHHTTITIGSISVDLLDSSLNSQLRTADTVTIVVIITSRSVHIDHFRLVSKGTARRNTSPCTAIPDRKGQFSIVLQPGFASFPVRSSRSASLDKGIKPTCSCTCSKQVGICRSYGTCVLFCISNKVFVLDLVKVNRIVCNRQSYITCTVVSGGDRSSRT